MFRPLLSSFRVKTPKARLVGAFSNSTLNNMTADVSTQAAASSGTAPSMGQLKTTTSAPTTARSEREIAERVQQRVLERDSWLVEGEPQEKHSHAKDMSLFIGTVLPKYVKMEIPSPAWLDQHFPVLPMDWKRLQQQRPASPSSSSPIQMTWLGHASVLIQVNGCTILTDPVFSQRCAPTQFAGPKRIRPPPCSIAELCGHIQVDLVLISHNHYDHLDYNTLRDFYKHSPTTPFVVPLGLRVWMHNNISKQAVVHEMDWHEHVDITYNYGSSAAADAAASSSQAECVRIISVPVHHWSSRIGADRDKTLWCGYSIVTQPSPSSLEQRQPQKPRKILFPGDTAWFDGLDELVGQAYGPFDVAAIPIGAYEPREFMKRNHINVDEAVRMKDAVQARHAVPIHWGTFPLTVEPILEPAERLEELMQQKQEDHGNDVNNGDGSFEAWKIGETKAFM